MWGAVVYWHTPVLEDEFRVRVADAIPYPYPGGQVAAEEPVRYVLA
jgi:hypothetical protein